MEIYIFRFTNESKRILLFNYDNLRHTFCTRLCESTNDIKFIQQVMGHADFSTTMDIYTHITQENMEEKAATIKGNLVLM